MGLDVKFVFRDMHGDDEMWSGREYEVVKQVEILLSEKGEPSVRSVFNNWRSVLICAAGNLHSMKGEHAFVMGCGLKVNKRMKVLDL